MGRNRQAPKVPLPPLAANIVRLREERHLTITETARTAGLTRTHLFRIENGRTPNPRRDTLVAIAKVFAVGLEELLDTNQACESNDVLEELALRSAYIREEDWALLGSILARTRSSE